MYHPVASTPRMPRTARASGARREKLVVATHAHPRASTSGRILAAATPLPASLEQIVSSFEAVPDPMARYKQLLFYATSLAPMDKQLKVEEEDWARMSMIIARELGAAEKAGDLP